ncbi:hypothetical protein QBC32DRAFT_324547 [Pseudoneurospora amorphoporcata]|uniref:Uncharacterized protein n=1 Tax=Pseudoneurospora amorphoporcata TaxID=241081 RepID=A0AAN6SFC7_9PEZI|nr:hypothetical protein QBC32DRAFT_324547 [Pseudoneurospora amorphoporcata]
MFGYTSDAMARAALRLGLSLLVAAVLWQLLRGDGPVFPHPTPPPAPPSSPGGGTAPIRR